METQLLITVCSDELRCVCSDSAGNVLWILIKIKKGVVSMFGKLLWVKPERFNRNPQDLDWVKVFPMKISHLDQLVR